MAPHSSVLMMAAFVLGLIPGLLMTWWSVRRQGKDSPIPSTFVSLALVRCQTLVVFGVLLPIALALAGLCLGGVLAQLAPFSIWTEVPSALVGGWTGESDPPWLLRIALVSAWATYIGSFFLALSFEQSRLEGRSAGWASPGIRRAHAVGLRGTYVLQWVLVNLAFSGLYSAAT